MYTLTKTKIFLILQFCVAFSVATKICYQCDGINCQRTSLNKTQQCMDDMDFCVTVYEGETIQAQGCLTQLPLEFRRKCVEVEASLEDDDNIENDDDDLKKRHKPAQCQQCFESHCNNVAPAGFECIQCDSAKDNKCRSDPSALSPEKCPVSRTNNVYCYVSDDGKRTLRGCVNTQKEQIDCLNQQDCMLCSPLDLDKCNVVQIRSQNDDGGNGNGGGNDNGSGNGNGGSNGNDGGNGGGNDNGGDNGNGGSNGNGGDNGNGGGNDGGNGGDGSNGGDNGGVVGLSSTLSINFIAFTFCFLTTTLFLF